jgi:AAA domain
MSAATAPEASANEIHTWIIENPGAWLHALGPDAAESEQGWTVAGYLIPREPAKRPLHLASGRRVSWLFAVQHLIRCLKDDADRPASDAEILARMAELMGVTYLPREEPARCNGFRSGFDADPDRNSFSDDGPQVYPGTKRQLITETPLGSRPGAPVALIDDPSALRLAGDLLPLEWLPMAFEGPWDQTDWSPLLSRRPVIIPANDPPGAHHAASLETYLRSIGIQASVLTLPYELPGGWHISDGIPDGIQLLYERQAPQTPLGKFYTVADLATYEVPPVHWIIEGWLPTGLTFLVGKSKIGKSWLALDLAMEIAAGRPVFGKVQTTQCDVLYIALEDHPNRMKSRVDKMLGSNEYSTGVTITHQWPTLDNGGLDAMASWLDFNPACRLIFVDIFVRIRDKPDGRSGVYQQDYQDVVPLQKFANERQVAIVLLHHTRKQEAADPFDTVSGSTGLMGAADTTMILTRRRGEPNGTLAIVGRDIIEDGEFAVRFDKETAKWTLLGPAAQIKAETEQQRVYDLLLASEETMGPADIASELSIGVPTVKTCLQRLKKRGAISPTKRGQWGIPGRDYRKAAPRDDD